MNEADARKVFGEFSCSVCGYLTNSPEIMQKHLQDIHPDLKKALRDKYNDMRQI